MIGIGLRDKARTDIVIRLTCEMKYEIADHKTAAVSRYGGEGGRSRKWCAVLANR